MKKKIINEFEIKLEFDKDTENPSRLFRSFADIIENIKNLDTELAKIVNSTVSTKIYLNDIEKGSLIGKLWNELIISDDGKIDDIDDPKKVAAFLDKSRSKTLEFIQEGKNSVLELENLSSDIQNIAQEEALDKTFNYSPPNILELAKNINEISETTKKLSDSEKLVIKNSANISGELKNNSNKIDIEEVEKALTAEEINNKTIVFYKIKRPDFLGDSQWEFKHGSKNIKVKILHDEWLEKFKNGQAIVIPGDSLKVKINQNFKYNRNGYLISEKTEIIEVIDIIKNQ